MKNAITLIDTKLTWQDGGCDYRMLVSYKMSGGDSGANQREATTIDLLHCLQRALRPAHQAMLLELLEHEPSAVGARMKNLREQVARTEGLLVQAIEALQAMAASASEPCVESCWHCGDALLPSPRPRCERCPDECDVEGCTAPGCSAT